jgi:hypothetical protein
VWVCYRREGEEEGRSFIHTPPLVMHCYFSGRERREVHPWLPVVAIFETRKVERS